MDVPIYICGQARPNYYKSKHQCFLSMRFVCLLKVERVSNLTNLLKSYQVNLLSKSPSSTSMLITRISKLCHSLSKIKNRKSPKISRPKTLLQMFSKVNKILIFQSLVDYKIVREDQVHRKSPQIKMI